MCSSLMHTVSCDAILLFFNKHKGIQLDFLLVYGTLKTKMMAYSSKIEQIMPSCVITV